MKRFVALARVSSREQEREGFSLDVQEEALRSYAEKNVGEIVRLFRIAETASKSDERKTFKALIAYCKDNAWNLDGLLFYKLDRAARNLFDYVELERLESEYELPFISVSQPTETTPAGRMMRRTMANMASFYTEQQSVDVREGLARRVQSGLFVSKAPYGYRNVRVGGRSLVEIDPDQAAKVRRIFQLFAYENCTLDRVLQRMESEGLTYSESQARFTRSKVHTILQDRSYIGEIPYKGQWYPGVQEPIVDRSTWDRVQALLGGHVYRSHELTFASNLIECGHCGHPITGERKSKQTKSGETEYVYYRCSRYNTKGHPRVRLAEAKIDEQVLALFDRLRIDDDDMREWFRTVLAAQTKDAQRESMAQREELQRQETLLAGQADRLLNLHLADRINEQTFAEKHTELRDRLSRIKLQLEVLDRDHDETAELAVKAFELSQSLRERWVTADYTTKRRILEIICLNCVLDDATLVFTMRKPFDLLAEGQFVLSSRDDRI